MSQQVAGRGIMLGWGGRISSQVPGRESKDWEWGGGRGGSGVGGACPRAEDRWAGERRGGLGGLRQYGPRRRSGCLSWCEDGSAPGPRLQLCVIAPVCEAYHVDRMSAATSLSPCA